MSSDPIVTTIASWLWDQYGKDLTNKALGKAREKWAKFRWKEAEAKYRARVREQHSTTRLLGHPKPISIEDIFTDVYVLDKPTAFQRFDLEELLARPFERESLKLDDKRKPALRLAVSKRRLFILGKPGAGKTTFLKYLTLQACLGKIPKTPIFASLKEWADSGLELMPFLIQQFEICAFPDAKAFIEHLLDKGNALMLFDGLDEVNQEGDQRAWMIAILTNFAKRYPKAQICLTCRIAATDYSFDQFTYLEIADFDGRQMRLFAGKWYQDDLAKLDRFLDEFEKPEHKGLRELAQTPLLLALLCLAFDETLAFPPRRVDLYKEALDALLKKWDASRGIRRDEIYRKLSPVRKEQLLARLAAQNFESGAYFVRQEMLVGQITHYLQQLPVTDLGDVPPDGEAILKAIEAQHGVLVERAHGIYSFSHLTFQEYFTARYIVENAASGTVARLVQSHLTDDRWHEVFLLTASLLDGADAFFEAFLKAVAGFIQDNDLCVALLLWAIDKENMAKQSGAGMRAFFLFIALNRASARAHAYALSRTRTFPDQDALDYLHNRIPSLDSSCNLVLDIARSCGAILPPELANSYDKNLPLNRVLNLALTQDLANHLGVRLQGDNSEPEWDLITTQAKHIEQYLRANQLLIECLQLAAVSDRKNIEARLLLPPGV